MSLRFTPLSLTPIKHLNVKRSNTHNFPPPTRDTERVHLRLRLPGEETEAGTYSFNLEVSESRYVVGAINNFASFDTETIKG